MPTFKVTIQGTFSSVMLIDAPDEERAEEIAVSEFAPDEYQTDHYDYEATHIKQVEGNELMRLEVIHGTVRGRRHMKVAVELCYTISAHEIIELPEGKTWDDVVDYYAKWGKLHLRFAGTGEDDYVAFDCGDASYDSVEWKYPNTVRVFETYIDPKDNEIETDYDKCLLEVNP